MQEIVTRSERLVLEESGIVSCKVFNILLGLEDAKEVVRAVIALSNDRKIPVFVDITESGGITKEARAYFASEEVARSQSACAMLISSPLSRLIGNFFLGLNKTKFPIRLFVDEDEAKNRLKTFL